MCCCKSFWKRVIPFALALMLGLLAANFLREEIFVNKIEKIESVKPAEKTVGKGSGIGSGRGTQEFQPASESVLKVLSKPQAKYTDAARKNEVQGTVVLKVTFLASGEIGTITVVTGLPDGLNEAAIEAAKQMRFEPPRKNGVPYAVTKTVAYTFTIY